MLPIAIILPLQVQQIATESEALETEVDVAACSAAACSSNSDAVSVEYMRCKVLQEVAKIKHIRGKGCRDS